MRRFVVASEKSWHQQLVNNLKRKIQDAQWVLVDKKEDLSEAFLSSVYPEFIFSPHWSQYIPPSIYGKFECVVFHMTDLPFGRGGSPLQNLIVKGYATTKISAIRVDAGIDTGPVYLKRDLDLSGTARDIFIRTSGIIEEMIVALITTPVIPKPQKGEIVRFRRR